MSLEPDMSERLARAQSDLRMGLPVILAGRTSAAMVFSAETLDAERLADLRALGGSPVLVITARRAETLKARVYDGDIARVSMPSDASINWIRSVADPSEDLRVPLKGPLNTQRAGSPELHRLAIRLVKAARVLPAALVLEIADASGFAAAHNLTLVKAEPAGRALDAETDLHPVIAARVPLEAAEAGRLHVFRSGDGSVEHYAVEIGRPARDAPVLTRLHSACFTGDILGSLKCDCGAQLRTALAQMGNEGAGVLLYLNQEGRGIGMANKMRAYSLQDQGFDTVEANHRLGFEDDERDFRVAAHILKRMGFTEIRLLTNNPRKIAMMESQGISVTERVPLKVGETCHNQGYLETKAAKSGHLL